MSEGFCAENAVKSRLSAEWEDYWTLSVISYGCSKGEGLHRKEKNAMLVTITGLNYRYGSEFLKKGMELKLIKEPDNKYDKEAIKVEYKGLGTIGYVANSTKTVIGECLSAGRLYDKIGKKAKAKVVIVLENAAICKVNK